MGWQESHPRYRPHRSYPKSAFGRLVLHLVSGHGKSVVRFLSPPIKQCFLEVFDPTNGPEKGECMMVAAIFDILKQKFGSSLQVSSLQRLGRELQNIEGVESKKTRFCTEYLVVRK